MELLSLVRVALQVVTQLTTTGVAFATPKGYEIPHLREITLVRDYGPKQTNQPKVPSVISFSPPSELGEGQWGFNLSPNSVSIAHTKLALDVQHVGDELDWTIQGLDGMKNLRTQDVIAMGSRPEFTYMAADQIVQFYLEKVFEHVLENHPRIKTLLDEFLVDIVITVPTVKQRSLVLEYTANFKSQEWSDAAKNSTFRAVTGAGFNRDTFERLNHVMFITESEAAAIYTARYLKDESTDKFLKVHPHSLRAQD
jgi:hypothetical protein